MARPNKKGLDYFPFDVDFATNAKVEAVMGEFGAKGVLIMIYLLSAVYQDGYFLRWNKLLQMQLANRVDGSSPELVNQIVDRLIDYGTFDKELFNSAKVLTSQRIQQTYLDATKRRKQQKPTLYWINDDNNPRSSVVNVDINPQSKVKESKVNKTKQRPLRQKRAKRVYDQESDYYKLAEFFVEKIRENNANFKAPNLQTWSDDFRKLIEIDKRDKHQVALLIKWVQHDSFWAPNVLSPSKLRKKFDQLAMKMDQDGSMGPFEPPVSKKPVYSDGEQRSIDIMQAFSTHDHDAQQATQSLKAKYPDITLEAVERQVYPERFRKEDVF